MRQLPEALRAFAAWQQFIIYVLVPSRTRPNKSDKFPCDFRTGRVVNAHDASIWTTADQAIAAAAHFGPSYGVGFVFTANDPFWFLDADSCLMPDNTWSPLAQSLAAALPGAAVEVSSSGKGLHFFGTGRPPTHGCRNQALGLEFYDTGRFVALTGIGAAGDAGRDMSYVLPWLVSSFFPSSGEPGAAHEGGLMERWEAAIAAGPAPEWIGPEDDAVLLERMLRSISARAAFSNGASFADLWNANVEVLARAYPPDPGSSLPYGPSETDRALAQHLAFWTGKHCARIERLMRQSALQREKWERDDYLPRTILSAVDVQRDMLTDQTPEERDTPQAPAGAPEGKVISGSTFLGTEEQINMFRGCVYVSDVHRAFVPGGAMLKPDQFRVMFGGNTMCLDPGNSRPSRDAWEVFTQSQCWRSPKVDTTVFLPRQAPGTISTEGGLKRVNSYWPVDVPRKVGDATPFLRHLELLMPVARDRDILLSYMAAIVQHQGVKFNWAPLIQGVEGNGKTLMSHCVAAAVGERYTYFPKASQIAAQFNAWQENCIFAAIEDIYIQDSQAHIMEELKPMVTGRRNEVQRKGVDQVTKHLCFNLILNSNHKGAIRKTRLESRFAVFFTQQQELSDLERDGMTPEYFEALHTWLADEGYAIVSELLHTMPINPEFNPANGRRAPITSSTSLAIEESLGPIEQEIQEHVAQGIPGFAGGWISSTAVSRMLERIRKTMSHRRQHDVLLSLGYAQHPGLPGGRVNNIIAPDATKPVLYIIRGHATSNMRDAVEIARHYTAAQTPAIMALP